ncbi:4a-hydroxytetrahydrobiopterin dehydratase [Microlunatus parietis]|uniref:Putative pterin-4-alpha-carbinolamine dehydratase n=1 Tax=Microlunatus parietis TaxID=682979 RepID=A0A7Y9I857_9ACTN|nr:4a-hydroxytetrahydrobiopterin dehydratase [Microlunatus parietis]NYE71509.1 4a-hydroxytetrahydrobiopterin dehydratase [Microlunatus parietis]
MSTKALTGQQIAAAGLDGWTLLLSYGQGGLQTRIHTENFAAGLRIVEEIGRAAAELNHHAELDLRPFRVDVRLTSREGGGVTEQDVTLARRISDLAAAAGTELECATVTRIELGLNTPGYAKIAPFWAAVLDGEHVIGTEDWGDVGDTRQALPMVWFQTSTDAEPGRIWHPHIWVDPAQVRPRIDAALAGGGTLVSDAGAPSSWLLADPDGNQLYLCTWQPGETVLCDSQYRPGGSSWVD